MSAVVLVLIGVLAVTVAAMTGLAVVIAGIRGEERSKSLSRAPHSRSGAVARRILGVHAAPEQNVHRIRIDARR